MSRKRILVYLAAIAGTVGVAIAFLPLHHLIRDRPGTVAFTEIIAVLIVATRCGMGPAIAASMVGILTWNFIYQLPYFALDITALDIEDAALLAAALTAAVVAGVLSGRAKRRADEAETKSKELKHVYATLQVASAEHERAEERFKTILEFSPDAIIIADDNGCVRLANRQAEQLFGYDRDTLIGMTVETLMPERFRTAHVGYRQNYMRHPRVRTMGSETVQVYGLRSDGTEFPAEVGLAPLKIDNSTLVTANVRDISKRQQAEKKLEESEARARRLVDANIIGVICWNVDGKITDANDAFLHVVGRTRAELSAGAISLSGITPPEYRFADARAMQELDTQGTCAPYNKEYLHADGSRVSVLVGGALLEGMRDKVVSFVLDLSEQKRIEARMRHAAQHDALTGLPNRALLEDRIAQAVALANRNKTFVALLLIDLDHFKNINDSLGHHVGDELLCILAKRLQSCLREGDSVARLGGDEFVICLPGISGGDDAALVAQKVLETLREPTTVVHHELHITGSIGISLYPSDGRDVGTLMRTADTAMYHAKENGRNTFSFFTAGLDDAAQSRYLIANRLHQALQRHELALAYQPQIDMDSGGIFAVEALIRWSEPELGDVPPGKFIRIAEETGTIASIGEWALRHACQDLSDWRRQGHDDLRVAVNLSPHQLRGIGFVELVARILKETALPASALEIEITESALMTHSQENLAALERLTGMGIRLAVDDFGIGYSSLSYLQRFPVNTIKIDQSFINGVVRDPNDSAIVTAVIAMARSLHLKVVAEGVETSEQVAFLRTHHCTAVQGYYYSKPVSADTLSRMLAQGIGVSQ